MHLELQFRVGVIQGCPDIIDRLPLQRELVISTIAFDVYQAVIKVLPYAKDLTCARGIDKIRELGAIDIDLGVKGIEQRLFFKFYAELIKNLSKSVDLIDLSLKSKFSDIVEETGVRIYG